ncbi:MAG: hypothetical protein K8I27_09820 [Planctomycetes bacterium]|nr:hypothetical protein [Planctomycetota bacterium]
MALLDNIPGWKVFSTGIGIAALGIVGFLVYTFFLATPNDLKELEEQAVQNAIEEVANIYTQKVQQHGQQRVIVMPVKGDTTNEQIREMLIARLNGFDDDAVEAKKPDSPSLEERAISIFNKVAKDEETERDPAAVFEDAGEVDEVISVAVTKKWAGRDSGVCKLDVTRIVKDDGTAERKAAVLETKHITGLSGTAIQTGEEEVEDGPGFWSGFGKFMLGLLIVFATVAILPFLSWPFAKAAFRADSNAANGMLLVGLTVLDLATLFAVSWLFAEAAFNTTAVISAGLLLPLALVWNLRLLNFIEEQ